MASSRSAGTRSSRSSTRSSSARSTRGRRAVERPAGDEDHAIIIGIERYRDRSVRALKGARADAQRFHRWVTSRRGGGVRRENVTLIAPPTDASEEGTIARIRLAFVELCERARGRARIGRRLYLYLAGHGIAQSREEASLFAADGGPAAPDRHIPGWCYASWFMYSAYFKEVVLFADCCRTAYRDLPVQPFPLDDVDSPSAGDAAYVKAFAVKYGQSALEVGSRSRKKAGGVFTGALLDALRNAFQGGQVTASSLEAYLHNHRKLNDWREWQEPSFIREGDVVFATRPSGDPRFPVEIPVKGEWRLEVQGGPSPGTWKIRPGGKEGRYLARLPVGIYAMRSRAGSVAFFEVTGESKRVTVTS